MNIRVCLAGATGWAGSALSQGVSEDPEMELVAAISRSHSGRNLRDVLGISGLDTPIYASAAEAVSIETDVFVEYTNPEVAKSNTLAALRNNAHVVIGTSGLSDNDYQEIHAVAKKVRRGVLAVGNFAITAVS